MVRTGLPGPAKALDPGPLVNREAWEVEPEEPAPLLWDSPAPPLGPRGRSQVISGCPDPVWSFNKYLLIIASCQPLWQAQENNAQDQV